MVTIGIIGAMEEEVTLLKEKIEVITAKQMLGLEFVMGKLSGKNVVIVRCGIGKVNAAICTQVLIDHFAVDYIINTGVAGGIYEKLATGDIVVSLDAVQHDMDCSVFGDPIGTIPRMEQSIFPADEALVKLALRLADTVEGHHVYAGRVASGDQFICTTEGRNKIWKNVEGYCAEMEGAAIAHACYLNKIPFVIIRCISDNADGNAQVSFEEFTVEAARISSDLAEKIVEAI